MTEEVIIKGQVIKATTNNYYVLSNGTIYNCASRGVIKRDLGRVVTGDFVEFSDGVITKVFNRKTLFHRPNVANVECLNIVLGAPPQPDFTLIDKMLAGVYLTGVKVYITVNKTDLSDATYNYVLENYKGVVDEILSVSALTGEGVLKLCKLLSGKLCAFAGQSAVGKTSLINAIFGSSQRVGELSEKLKRGKHTTTSSEIFIKDDLLIVDTPGFAEYFCDIEPEDLKLRYPEFLKYSGACYFSDCLHISEPDCAVKMALENREISNDRYNRYIEIYNELKEKKNGKY